MYVCIFILHSNEVKIKVSNILVHITSLPKDAPAARHLTQVATNSRSVSEQNFTFRFVNNLTVILLWWQRIKQQ